MGTNATHNATFYYPDKSDSSDIEYIKEEYLSDTVEATIIFQESINAKVLLCDLENTDEDYGWALKLFLYDDGKALGSFKYVHEAEEPDEKIDGKYTIEDDVIIIKAKVYIEQVHDHDLYAEIEPLQSLNLTQGKKAILANQNSTNFKGDVYPKDISTVVTDMQGYISLVNQQLQRKQPYYIKDFITASNGRNKKEIKKFEQAFGFNSDNQQYKGKEIKGLYVFAEEQAGKLEILNVGISKTIMRRMYQHATGKLHNEATLVFYMAQEEYEKKYGKAFKGKREQFPFEEFRADIQKRLKRMRFAIVPIDNNYELYMAEIYLSCHYKTYWNSFETH